MIEGIERWIKRTNAKNVIVIESTWQDFLSSKITSSVKYNCVFFDDFPLSDMKQNERLKVAAEILGSRWHVFLSMVTSRLAKSARASGYMAERLKWNRKDVTLELALFPVSVPEHCVYAKGKTHMYVPLFRFGVRVEIGDGVGGDGVKKKKKKKKCKKRKLLDKVLSQLGMCNNDI